MVIGLYIPPLRPFSFPRTSPGPTVVFTLPNNNQIPRNTFKHSCPSSAGENAPRPSIPPTCPSIIAQTLEKQIQSAYIAIPHNVSWSPELLLTCMEWQANAGCRFEKSLYDLIRGLRNHKGKEREYIQESLRECRKEIRSNDMG